MFGNSKNPKGHAKQTEEFTEDWDLFQKGVEYKNQIGLYETVAENYRFYQGDQWHGVKSEGLPTPVFNIIKPVLRYKVSTIMQNDIKIKYSCGNIYSDNRNALQEVADKLSGYAEKLWERLKLDYYNSRVLSEAGVTGDGISYFYYDEPTKEVKMDLIDSVNVYPANPNVADVQDQDYIIISFRRTVSSVRREAIDNGMSKEDAEAIVSDNDTINEAGDSAKIELNDSGKCIVLLKLWKDEETGTVHFRKSTRNVIIVGDTDTGCKRYPVAMFNWEPQKNSFHGVSDVTELIPNQIYINKIAAMMMLSTMYTAFPKMVYDENLVENPSNQIGVAIGVNGSDRPIGNIIDYITPASVSNDAFSMFERTISLTKELMGANDGALGNVNPEKTSGKAILAMVEQSALPLDSHKHRFYNYIEDVALIWADMWQAYTDDKGKDVYLTTVEGDEETGNVSRNAFDELMLEVRIDVGPASRWNELVLCQTLENLLNAGHIDFEQYVNLMPENTGFPKQQLTDMIEKLKEAQMVQSVAGGTNPSTADAVPLPFTLQGTRGKGGNNVTGFDVDAFVEGLPEEVKAQVMQNPQMLEQLLMNTLGIQAGGEV